MHWKIFMLKKVGKGIVFQDIEMYFYMEMREIGLFWNTVNPRYLKAEVRPKLILFQSNFSGSE